MTFNSPIFRKLFATSFLLIGASLFLVDFYLTQDIARRERRHAEQRLFAQATALLGELSRTKPEDIPAWAGQTARRTGVRITVIDSGGVVLADSEGNPQTMENHSNRPEIRQAQQAGRGSAVRHSSTLNRDLCYAALRLTLDNRPGYVLRLAVPLEDLDRATAAVRIRVLGASAASALAAMILAYFFARSFARRIRGLQDFAEELVDSKFKGVLPPAPADELGGLARSLNSMAARLREMVDGLKLESERRESILSSMAEGVLAVDHQMRVLFCNSAFARLYGAQLPAPGSLPLVELSRDSGLRQVLQDVLATGDSVTRRIQLQTSQGRTFDLQAVSLSATPGRGALAILHDITDLERLDRVRRDFVANVSHELRTPLTSIRGCAETLLDGALEDPETNRHFVEVIQANAIRLNRIALDLLTLSELEAGKSGLEPEPVPLGDALESALHMVETEALLRHVKLLKGSVEDVSIRADRLRLEQVLVNLLDNAVKFNRPSGRVEIDILRADGGKVTIKISDTGIGIPSSDLPRIFERFYRVDKARSREVGGTGLGLSIVKHIVEVMGGAVSVESQLGKGSVFTVTLPAA